LDESLKGIVAGLVAVFGVGFEVRHCFLVESPWMFREDEDEEYNDYKNRSESYQVIRAFVAELSSGYA
jgi:hypothetical protein